MPKQPFNTDKRLRCTTQQIQQWARAADGAQRGLSDWIRLTLDRAAGKVKEKVISPLAHQSLAHDETPHMGD